MFIAKDEGKVTPHDFYIKKKYYQQNQVTELEYVTINRTVDSGSYTKTKQLYAEKLKKRRKRIFAVKYFNNIYIIYSLIDCLTLFKNGIS